MYRKFKKGFTMVELLVAMAIVGLLIATAIWGIGVAQQSARNTQRREAGAQILAGFSEYYSRFNTQAAAGRLGTDGLCICNTTTNATSCTKATPGQNCYFISLNGIVTGTNTSVNLNVAGGQKMGAETSASNTQWIIGNGSTVGGTKICASLEGGGFANLSEPQSLPCP